MPSAKSRSQTVPLEGISNVSKAFNLSSGQNTWFSSPDFSWKKGVWAAPRSKDSPSYALKVWKGDSIDGSEHLLDGHLVTMSQDLTTKIFNL